MKPAAGIALGGRYRLVRLIAVGGMGEVWVAHDESLARDVAVKVLKEEFAGNEDFLDRLRTEARNSAALSHSNIAQLYDYGEQQGSGYLVMELVHGEPMSDLLEREPVLPVLRLLSILSQTARALHAAHVAGVVHRDVKPGNILLERGGEVKITDFGVSLAANQMPMTAAGMVMGTAQYLAPEQAIGKAATGASDIYALGIVAYESILGNRPFTGATPVDIAIAQVNEAVPPLPATVHAGFADLIMRMLEKDPLDRPRSGAILARNFDLLAQEIAADPWGSGLRRRSDDPRPSRRGDRAALTGEAPLAAPAPRRARTTPATPVAGAPTDPATGPGTSSGSSSGSEPPTSRAGARLAAEREVERGVERRASGEPSPAVSSPAVSSSATPIPRPAPLGPVSSPAPVSPAVGQGGWQPMPPQMPPATGTRPHKEVSTATPPAALRPVPAGVPGSAPASLPRSVPVANARAAADRAAGGRTGTGAASSQREDRTRSTLHSEQRPAPTRAAAHGRSRPTAPARPRDGARPARSTPARSQTPPRRTSTTTGLRIGRLGWPTFALMFLVLVVVLATIVKAFTGGSDDSAGGPAPAATSPGVTVSVQFTSVADADAMIVHVTGSNPSNPAPPTTPKDT